MELLQGKKEKKQKKGWEIFSGPKRGHIFLQNRAVMRL